MKQRRKIKGFQVLCLIKTERKSSINISLAVKWISFISINKDACLHNMLRVKDFYKESFVSEFFACCCGFKSFDCSIEKDNSELNSNGFKFLRRLVKKKKHVLFSPKEDTYFTREPF